MIRMKQTMLALAVTGMLAGPALAAEGLYAEVPGALALQPVQAVEVSDLVAELPAQPALAEVPALVAAGTLPAELPELPAALALTPPEPFSAADMQALFVPGHEPLRVAVLSPQEMEETKGAAVPLFWAAGALVVRGATHFVPRAAISSNQATRLASAGKPVFTNNVRAGQQVANQAFGRGNVTFHNAHRASPIFRPHFQPTVRHGNQSHIFIRR